MNPDPAGEGLKSRLLPGLLDELQVQRQRRAARRRAAGAAMLLALALGVGMMSLWGVNRPGGPGRHTSTDATVRVRIVAANTSAIDAWRIETRKDALSRAAVRPRPDSINVLDDDRLLAILASMGHPAGLVRSGGRAWVTPDVITHESGEPG